MPSKIVRFDPERAVDSIQEDSRARKDYGDIEDFALELQEHGIINPLTVDSEGVLVAGGRRLAAAIMAGLTTVPVNIIEKSTDITHAEIELFENMYRKDLAWHEQVPIQDKLYKHYREKAGGELTLERASVMFGVSKTELHRRLTLASYLEVAPELRKFETATQAERHLKTVLRNVRARKSADELEVEIAEPEQVQKEKGIAPPGRMPHYKAIPWMAKGYAVGDFLELGPKVRKKGIYTLAEVDPPYGIDLTGSARNRAKGQEKHDRYNEVDASSYPAFLEESAALTYQLLGDNSFCIWWFGLQWYEHTMKALKKAKFKFHHIPCIWTKEGKGQTTNPTVNLAHTYETFFICRKGSVTLPAETQGKANEFRFASIRGEKKYHATQRPMALMIELLRMLGPPGGPVLIPFLGSGATMAAAGTLGRFANGWDLDRRNRDLFLSAILDPSQDVYLGPEVYRHRINEGGIYYVD